MTNKEVILSYLEEKLKVNKDITIASYTFEAEIRNYGLSKGKQAMISTYTRAWRDMKSEGIKGMEIKEEMYRGIKYFTIRRQQ